MSTLLWLLLVVMGILFFSFTLWKRLKEDYKSDDIFSFTMGILFGSVIGLWTGDRLQPGIGYWLALTGGVLAGLYFMKKFSFRFFEVVDAVAPAFFWLSLFLFLAAAARTPDAVFFTDAGISLAAVFAYSWFLGKYRTLSFYPSGKLGFAGLAALGIFFALKSSVEMTSLYVLSSVGNLWSVGLSLALAIVFLVTLYLRSGNERSEKLLLSLARLWQNQKQIKSEE